MRYFIANLLLALLWAAGTATFSLSRLVTGFVIGYLVLSLGQPVLGESRYFRKSLALGRFLGFLAFEIVKANLVLAHDIVTPTHRLEAGVIAVPLEARTPFEITALANLITLTPGTLSLDLSEDLRTLYVHAMFPGTADEARRRITEGFERKLLELLR